ncbi:MAG: response regulator [Clostridia bacterium]|nr:response regulator [Clostridia bacterium]
MQYRVFLVDDEIAIREGIRNSRIWDDERFTLVGEAPDGEIALSMVSDVRPDILLTDVRMPFMDGMQLATEISRQMPWIQIVILSGYDDFNYARQAMSLGVQEYLLKPVSARDLLEALERAAQRLEKERRGAERAESLRRRLAGSSRFMKEKLLYTILMEPMTAQEEARSREEMRALGMDLDAPCYIAGDIAWQGPEGGLSEGQDALYALAERSGGRVYACAGRHGTLILVLGASDREAEERAYSFARSALEELRQLGASAALASVGDPVTRLGLASDSMHTARHLRHLSAASGMNGFAATGSRELQEGGLTVPETDVRPLYERLQYAQAEEAEGILEEYAATLGGTDIHSQMVDNYLRVETLMTASRILHEAGGRTADIPEAARLVRRLSDAERAPDMDAAAQLLRCALLYRDAKKPSRGSAMLSRARAYLAQHFSNANLMLRDVSEYVGMSDSRFSAVFGQQMGMTFTEYLTTLRMSKAKELLSATAMRSSEIAQAVGYNDPHYFSYLFRKHTGMTPSDFRRQSAERISTGIKEN